MHAFALGLVAGLAVAMPLGPIGVLLLRESLLSGRRRAVAAALGVATVDTVYAVAAVLVGAQVALLVSSAATVIRVVSGAALLVVGVVGLVGWWRTRDVEPVLEERAAGSAYLRFVAYTALNPATLLIFATVATGAVAELGDGRPSFAVGAAFVAGVTTASAGWQVVLVVLGGLAGARLGPRLRAWVSPIGSALVVGLAAWVLVG
ncbi:LysE family translocator [Cellulomonas sp. PhB150]|uniref:LysE family translocator n=1 Tax=Cellulomonas sp. PhB150 TaxID=2485188 RepID=UPI000F4648AA|nr:LysE family transporter [Cellulomonas sp. PhB150]ROS23605.1 arginine exporter protein ArgO [Cellulomonas sp. PhB150]